MASDNDLGNLMNQARQMQEKVAEIQEQMTVMEVTGESGAGLVKVQMTGRHDVKKIDIDPGLLKESKEILEDMIAAAVNDAVRKTERMQQEQMSQLTGGFLPPGFKLPFI